jgi:hypothetical protein
MKKTNDKNLCKCTSLVIIISRYSTVYGNRNMNKDIRKQQNIAPKRIPDPNWFDTRGTGD